MSIKPLSFTTHATDAIAERELDRSWIEEAARRPDWVEKDRNRPGVERRFKAIVQYEGRVLRVAVVETATEIRIVTVFFDRKAQRR